MGRSSNESSRAQVKHAWAWARSPSRLGGDACFVFTRFAEDVPAAPHGLDIVLAVRCIGELLAKLTDEDVDDLQLRLVHAAVEMIEEHLFGQGCPFAQTEQLKHL